MPDKYIQFANFKFGLDTRRSEMTAQPGALVTLENAFINVGGEIEKRKAFVQYANVSILDTLGDQGTYGLEVASTGLVVFGSALVYGTTPTLSQPVLASAMPSGVTYQQLKHPFVSGGGTYDKTKHRVTSVKTCNFNGKIVAAVTFTDNNSFLFYDGTLVLQSREGLVITGASSQSDLATDLAASITALGWTATASGNTVTIKSPVGETGVIYTIEEDSTNGNILQTHTAGSSPDVTGAGAVAKFNVDSMSGSVTAAITAPNAAGTGTITLASGLSLSGTAAAVAALIAAAINDTVSSPDYIAFVVGTVVTVVGPTGNTNINTKNLSITWTGTGTLVLSSTAFSAQISPNPVEVIGTIKTGFNSVSVYAFPTAIGVNYGGTLSYVWSIDNRGLYAGLLALSNETTVSPTLLAVPTRSDLRNFTVVLKCVITDSAGPPTATAYGSVNFYITAL